MWLRYKRESWSVSMATECTQKKNYICFDFVGLLDCACICKFLECLLLTKFSGWLFKLFFYVENQIVACM